MSVNFDPVSSNIRTSLVNSSSSPSASIAPSSSTESSAFYKLIAFPSNSASSSSLSVNSQDNNKNYQHNDQQECLDNNLMVKHCLSESTSPSSSSLISSKSTRYDMTNELRRSQDNRYSRVKGLDQEWYSARKRQLDEILAKLQHLHKLNLDDRENIEGMKKKTIKLIATYSNITMKTNNFLTRWERKHGSKLKSYQNSSLSSSSPAPSTFSSSADVYGDKYEPDFLFNTSGAW